MGMLFYNFVKLYFLMVSEVSEASSKDCIETFKNQTNIQQKKFWKSFHEQCINNVWITLLKNR